MSQRLLRLVALHTCACVFLIASIFFHTPFHCFRHWCSEKNSKLLWLICILFGPTRFCPLFAALLFWNFAVRNLMQSVWHLEAARLCGCSVCSCNRRGPWSHNSLGSPTKAYISEWPVTRQTNTHQMETGERADLTWHQLQRRSAPRVGFCKTRGNLFGVSQGWSGSSKATVFGRRAWRC